MRGRKVTLKEARQLALDQTAAAEAERLQAAVVEAGKESTIKTGIRVPVGTILNYSIGCGCNQFFQVIEATPKSVKARSLNCRVINRSVKFQTCDYLPIRDSFEPPSMGWKYAGKKNAKGEPICKQVDEKTVVLKVKDSAIEECGFQIGPVKRMMGWSVWDGKQREQKIP